MVSEFFPIRKLTIGDQWKWQIRLSQYPSSQWTLSYSFKTAGQSPQILTATANPDGIAHDISVSAAVNSLWAPGKYAAYVYITSQDDERQTLGMCAGLEVLPDPATLSADYGTQTYAERCLATLEGVLTGSLSREHLETTFKDASFKYKSTMELIRLREYFQREVRRERGIRDGRIVLKRAYL